MALLIPWLLAWCLVAALAPAARAQRAPQLPKKEAFDPPPIDRSAQTQLFAATSFLYTGRSAVQVGVAPGTIKEERVALIRGRVVDALGKGVASVRIAVEGHAEFGETKTREDGQYDLAVNGGGALVLDFSLSGYIPVHRRVESAWQEYVPVENVILTRLDPVVTHVDLSQTAQPFVVASGSVRSDASGTRQSRLLFARNTTAQLRLPNGTTQPIGNLAVHATEFTVGTGGPAAMPADLPDSSAYTYAVDFAVEQAMQAGATGVEFTQPVINYVENFIGFSVGTPVPCGRYDRVAQAWVPEPNGLVIRVLSVTGGLANIDVIGNGVPSTTAQLTAVGITNDERTTLAALYPQGGSLWRVPVRHFSSYDYNWGIGFPTGATEPNGGPDNSDDGAPGDENACGSILGIDAQTLGEELPIVGTPYALRYQSERTPGAVYKNSVGVQLSGATVPSAAVAIVLSWTVAGQSHRRTFPSAPNQRYTIQWDGRDAYGRLVQGSQICRIYLGYEYPVVYRPTPGFGRATQALTGMPTWTVSPNARQTAPIERGFTVELGAWSAEASSTKLGGWTLSVHHAYQPLTRRLELGSGGHRSQGPLNMLTVSTLENTPHGNAGCFGMAVAPDGAIYYAAGASVQKVVPGGIPTTFAGGGNPVDHIGDGGLATLAYMNATAVALGSNGDLYIADGATHRIRKVGSDGIIHTVAGSGNQGWTGSSFLGAFTGDGGPATQARLNLPQGLAVTADGDIYFCDRSNNRVRKVDAAGTITTVAGGSTTSLSVPPMAVDSRFFAPRALTLCPQGGYYFAVDRCVLRVDASGGIRIVAGGLTAGYGGDGGPAVQALVSQPSGLLALANGDLLIADASNHRVRIVSQAFGSSVIGPINTFLGTGFVCNLPQTCGDGGNAALASVGLPRALGMSPDGKLYVGEDLGRIRVLAPSLPGLTFGEHLLPSEDGSEVYAFDAGGRHLRTLHGLTGATKSTFTYDTAGHLVAVTDAYNNTTGIVRASSGQPILIVSPYNQVTTLETVGNYLTKITDPAGGEWNCQYDALGLLRAFADPNGHVATFDYADGRLIRDTDAAGGAKTLAQTTFRTNGGAFGVNAGTTVTLTTAQGRASTYRREQANGQFGGNAAAPGVLRRTNTSSTGSREITDYHPTGKVVQTKPDGTRITTEVEPGPRFGLAAPVTTFREVRTPAGLTETTVSPVPTVVLATPGDPFSVLSITSTETRNGRTTTTAYVHDPVAGTRTVTVTSPAGRVRVQRFDAQGRILSDRFGNLATTTYQYDARGRLVGVTRSDGTTTRQTTMTYGNHGFLASVTDPIGRTTSYQYDAAGRVVTETLPDLNQVHLGYDAAGNNTSLQPPGRLPHQFVRSAVDQVTSYDPPSVGTGNWSTTHAYSADRQLTRTTRPAGDTVDYVYNASGLVSDVVHAGGLLSMTYDLLSSCCMGGGRVASITRQDNGQPQANGLAFTYDGPLMTSLTATGAQPGVVSWTYNNDLLRQSESVNGANTVAYAYDADRLLTGAGAETLVREPQNGLVIGTSIGAFTSTRNYNSFGELTGIVCYWNASVIASFGYVRDALGRITQATEIVQGVTTVLDYTYDLRGRLVQVLENSALRASYTYDANGNRLSKTDATGTVNAVYDDQDRLLSYGGATFTYSRAGELETMVENGQTTAYTYDAIGALVQVALPGGGTVRYESAGADMRVTRRVNGNMTGGWIYRSELTPVAGTDALGGVAQRYVFGMSETGAPDYMMQAGAAVAFVKDALGSPRLVLNVGSGGVVQALTYDEYGQSIQDSSPGSQPFGFAGGLMDTASQLLRFGRRDYSPRWGRWTCVDPWLFHGGDTNCHAYCLGDPVNSWDYTGRIPVVAVAVAMVVVPAGVNAAVAALMAQDGDRIDAAVAAATAGALAGAVTAAGSLSAAVGAATIAQALLAESAISGTVAGAISAGASVAVGVGISVLTAIADVAPHVPEGAGDAGTCSDGK